MVSVVWSVVPAYYLSKLTTGKHTDHCAHIIWVILTLYSVLAALYRVSVDVTSRKLK